MSYGPSIDDQKSEFIRELSILSSHVQHPWIIVGDFNVVRWVIDRPGEIRGWYLMNQFNDLIREEGWVDVELQNRQFTWTSKRPTLSFSKIDRTFISAEWAVQYPMITLEAQAMVVSDHVPLLLKFWQHQTSQIPKRVEKFWLEYEEVGVLVKTI